MIIGEEMKKSSKKSIITLSGKGLSYCTFSQSPIHDTRLLSSHKLYYDFTINTVPSISQTGLSSNRVCLNVDWETSNFRYHFNFYDLYKQLVNYCFLSYNYLNSKV